MICYHITNAENINSIIAEGIKPMLGERAKMAAEPDEKTYFYTVKEMCKDLLSRWEENGHGEGISYAVVELDIPDEYLFKHKAYEMCSFETIPPNFITNIVEGEDVKSYLITTLEYVIKDIKNFNGVIETILYDGVCRCTQRTKDDFLRLGYSVLSKEETENLYNDFYKEMSKRWVQITQNDYVSAYTCEYPMKVERGGFFTSQVYVGELYPFYQEYYGRYYKSVQCLSAPRDIIISNLRDYIEDTKFDAILNKQNRQLNQRER